MTHPLIQRALDGMRAQGSLAFDEKANQCLLRTADGLRCAVGHLIADEHYHLDMEQLASPASSQEIRDAIRASNPDLCPIPENNPVWAQLSELQEKHDNSGTIEEFLAC